MTKEQLLALRPYQEVKINSQWPAPEVSVEDKRVILQNFDKQKKDAKMDPFPYVEYYPDIEEDKVLKKVRKL